MRINKATIHNFKNLKPFIIDFSKDFSTTVILGRNGTGKSNLLEALIIIFRDLDLGEDPRFKYEITYEITYDELTHEISIDADPARSSRERMLIKVDGVNMTYAQFKQQPERRYLPSYVFGYYSGSSSRMEAHFEEHQKRFYKDLLDNKQRPLRPLLYARLAHSHFVLLSFFNEEDPEILHFLKEHLGILGMDSVLFVMKKPPWDSNDGDPRFWNARGVVSEFLDKLYRISLAPLRLPRHINMNFKSTPKSEEHLYLYLENIDALKELSYLHIEGQDENQEGSQQVFFKALESTYISDILSEVRVQVKVRNANGSLTFRDLSEGEQQLLMVLGLLRFTKSDEALFLLDEPDTHLNPIWSIRYLDFINKVAGPRKTSQIIMVTHNPLVISSLEKQQVRMMLRNENTGYIYVEEPEKDPQGMGVDAMLTSELFGLRSSLGIPTQQLLDERRRLIVKKTLSIDERKRLEELNEALSSIDFSVGNHDPEYARFIRRKVEREDEAIREMFTLTPQQIKEQNALVEEILDELEEEEQQA